MSRPADLFQRAPHRLAWAWLRALLPLALLVLLGPRADAQPADEPILHEYIPPDTTEDLSLSTTTASGQLPAAIRTPSGAVTPPDLSREPERQRVYREQDAADPSYRPDRDTRRPEVEHYDDPFSPSLTPFKRLYAYDAVRDDYSLYVRGSERPAAVQYRAVPVADAEQRGERPGEERFFGDLGVDLVAGQYVRIPSVGPDTRLVRLVTVPAVQVSIWRDGADNWFALSSTTGRARLVTELAIARDTFGSAFADVAWGDLPRVPRQPSSHEQAFQQVTQAIGVSRAQSPREVLTRLVGYFRSFEPSNEPPRSRGDIYLDLALSRKGVCRHRAFAFVVTALHIGLPARFVNNEAHAWVEVSDGHLWHRIDLGGAAAELIEQPHPDRPPHLAPPDPYAWPTGRDAAEDLAQRSRQAAAAAEPAPGPTPAGSPPEGPAPARPIPPAHAPSPAAPMPGLGTTRAPVRPSSTLEIERVDHDVFRGFPLHLQGSAHAAGRPCQGLRVDVQLLVGADKLPRTLGSLSTDASGHLDGAVVLPRDVALGDHELSVVTSGDEVCGPGQGY